MKLGSAKSLALALLSTRATLSAALLEMEQE